jgi:hypothetical protein
MALTPLRPLSSLSFSGNKAVDNTPIATAIAAPVVDAAKSATPLAFSGISTLETTPVAAHTPAPAPLLSLTLLIVPTTNHRTFSGAPRTNAFFWTATNIRCQIAIEPTALLAMPKGPFPAMKIRA